MPSQIGEISHIDLGAAGTISSFTFPHDTKRFTIQVVQDRDTNPRLVAFHIAHSVEDLVDGDYITMPAGMNYWEADLAISTTNKEKIIYIQPLGTNNVAEISIWRY